MTKYERHLQAARRLNIIAGNATFHGQDSAAHNQRAMDFAKQILKKAERAAEIAASIQKNVVQKGRLPIYHYDVVVDQVKKARDTIVRGQEFLQDKRWRDCASICAEDAVKCCVTAQRFLSAAVRIGGIKPN